jgi:RimJ/RimL family protein N-acetyltransferase
MVNLLRDVLESDFETFFEHQQDKGANYMAAFTSPDPSNKEAFFNHWTQICANNTLIKQTLIVDGKVAGSFVCFEMFEQRQVGYWIGREFWGKGIATKALHEFLGQIEERPLYGRCVKDNIGSIRVLEKCGFKLIGEERAYANARGEEVDELVLKLE